jgi:hypothetical protein
MPDAIIFAIDAESTFWLQGRKYRVGEQGMRALKLIALMVEASDRGTRSPSCLLSYRARARDVVQSPPRALLVYVAEKATNPAVQRAAIWLRGRCRGSLGTATLARLWMSADVGLRKEITRAFKRMEAWDYLRVIETSDPNLRIRRLANQPTPRAFPVRLARFLACIKRREVGRSAPLFLSDVCDPTGGRPAKPDWLIRRILEHIRWLVRAPVERDEPEHSR